MRMSCGIYRVMPFVKICGRMNFRCEAKIKLVEIYLAHSSKFELLGLLPSVARVAKVTVRRSLKVLRLLQVEFAN
jgi:hypothetical protein